LNSNLKVLAQIDKLITKNNSAYYSDIESYLNRGRNQISAILTKLENDDLIQRIKEKRPQRIMLTESGRELLKTIRKELS
ncbi:MAG: winged helix DNA-binding protein, partial [Promethearchaeota archaeon]